MLIKNNRVLKQTKFENKEKGIQTFVEEHIPEILGDEYEFVCTEFSVGDFRVDSLVFNKETKSFIIIEDKNVQCKSLLAQGLTYLKVLKDRKEAFILKYNDVKKMNYNLNDIDLSQSRVMFFSTYYDKYELYSADYENLPFDFYKITKYEDDIIDIEKIANRSKMKIDKSIVNSSENNSDLTKEIVNYTEDYHLNYYNVPEINNCYNKLKERILELGDIDTEFKKIYIAFKGRKNIVDVEIYKKFIQLTVNIKKDTIKDPNQVMKCYISDDGKSIGHHGNGDYYFCIYNEDDIDKVMPIIKQSYEINKK